MKRLTDGNSMLRCSINLNQNYSFILKGLIAHEVESKSPSSLGFPGLKKKVEDLNNWESIYLSPEKNELFQ